MTVRVRLPLAAAALVIAVVVASLWRPAAAQTPAPVATPTFEERLERLATEVERLRVQHHVPGAALAVVRDGKVVFARGFGLADLENKIAVTPDTRFFIGSTTKAFTATLVGMLVDEGRMTWDDPVERHLPYFTLDVESIDDSARATLRDLLTHRTGYPRMAMLSAGGALTSDEILRRAVQAEPFARFRQRFYYNNEMYLAAGTAAAAAAGTDWQTLVSTRIIAPLGMTDTRALARDAQGPRLARGYTWNEDLGTFERQTPGREGVAVDPIAPAGAISSTVLDMAKWLQFQLASGEVAGRSLIRAETLHETWRRQISIGGGVGYGLGWMVRTWRGQRLIEHGGNLPGFSAEVGFLPDAGLGFVLLTNATSSPLQALTINLVPEILLGEVSPASAQAAAAAAPEPALVQDFSPYLGRYVANFATFSNETFTILEQNGRLALDIPSQQVFELNTPGADGRWRFTLTDQIAVSFDRNNAGEVVALRMHQAGMAFEVPREGIEIVPEIDPAALQKYLGVYRNSDINVELTVLVQNQRLAFQPAGGGVLDLHPPDDNGRWVSRARADLSLVFREENGAVTAVQFFRPNKQPVLNLPYVEGTRIRLPSVEEILALRARSSAGAEIRNFRMEGTIRFPQAAVDGRFAITVAGDDRVRTEIDLGPFGRIQSVLNGERAWSATSFEFDPFTELRGDMLAQARQTHPAALEGDWRKYFDAVTVVSPGQFAGRPVYLVRLQDEGLPAIRLSVDAETGDILRVERQTIIADVGAIPVTTVNEDYRTTSGVRMPYRSVESNEQTGRMVFTVERVQTNLELSDDVFVLVPDRP